MTNRLGNCSIWSSKPYVNLTCNRCVSPEMELDQAGDLVLSDRVLVNGNATAAALSAAGELRWMEGGRRRSLAVEKEVLGFATEGLRIEIRAVVERGSEICCGGGTAAPVRKSFVLELPSDESLRLWCQKLQDYIYSLGRPKRLIVFVNPFGGNKSASKIFIDDVKPLLEDANIEYTLQETKYQLHANEVAQSLDLSKYDGIVCVSGDGILVEMFR